MQGRYPHLLQPLTVGKTTFRNRIFTAPVTLHSMQAAEPYPTESVITHFANKAKGGAACVTCCGVNIFRPDPKEIRINWNVYEKAYMHYLADLADRIHVYGAKASMELGAVGVVRSGFTVSDGAPMIDGTPGKEMPEPEMERYADAFAYSAGALREVGFDMVLLHFGHGLTMGQFLSPLTNKRTDKYGGSLENRARFPMMIIDRIRNKVGRDLLIEVRISGDEHTAGGIRIDDAIGFTKLVEEKIDFIHVSAGRHGPKGMTIVHPTSFLPPTPNAPLAEAMKKANVKIPVVTIGGIQDLDDAENILAEGKADLVTMARGFIADPDLGEKAYKGAGEDVTPCVKCMRCHDSAVWGYHYVCSVNPVIGLEHKISEIVPPVTTKKKVVVLGGGPAGMKAALTASDRGHDVTLFEMSDALGGILKSTEFVSFKYDLNRYKEFLKKQVFKSTIKVHLNTVADPALVLSENPDVVIAALGAEPLVPPIPGVENENVMPALYSYGKEEQLGRKIVVIGGGQVGCETALHLMQFGKEVTLLEMLNELALDASTTQRLELLNKMDETENLKGITNARCTAISKEGVTYSDKEGKEIVIEAENVLMAAGMKSRSAKAFRGLSDRFYSIGDCERVANVERAVNSAYFVAARI